MDDHPLPHPRPDHGVSLNMRFNIDMPGHAGSYQIEVTVTIDDTSYTLWDDGFVVLSSEDINLSLAEIDSAIDDHPFKRLLRCESPIERKFLVFALNDIPNLRPQYQVGPYYIDLAIPEKRVAIELDGHDFHKTKDQRTNDAQRERYLQKNGWTVIRFTGSEIHTDVDKCLTDAIEIVSQLPTQELT